MHRAAQELRAVMARRGDVTVTELVELAVTHDVPAADLLAAAAEVSRDDDASGTRR